MGNEILFKKSTSYLPLFTLSCQQLFRRTTRKATLLSTIYKTRFSMQDDTFYRPFFDQIFKTGPFLARISSHDVEQSANITDSNRGIDLNRAVAWESQFPVSGRGVELRYCFHPVGISSLVGWRRTRIWSVTSFQIVYAKGG